MGIETLPNELILEVAGYLDRRSLNYFIQTQRRFASLLTHSLYDAGLQFGIECSPCRGPQALLTPGIVACSSTWKSDYLVSYFMDRDDTTFVIEKNLDDLALGALALMAEMQNLSMVTALLDAGMSPDGKSRRTCMNGCDDLDYLSGLDSPLEVALSKGYNDIAERLLDAGATAVTRSFDKLGHIAIHCPALCLIEKSSVPLVERLIRAVIDAEGDILDVFSETNSSPYRGQYKAMPLHAASYGGNLPVVHLVLEWGACVMARTPQGELPVHFAVRSGNSEVVRFLLQRMPEGSSKTIGADHPELLFDALKSAPVFNLDVIKLLLSTGSDVFALHPDPVDSFWNAPPETALGTLRYRTLLDARDGEDPDCLKKDGSLAMSLFLKAVPDHIWDPGDIRYKLWQAAGEGESCPELNYLGILNGLAGHREADVESTFLDMTLFQLCCYTCRDGDKASTNSSLRMIRVLLEAGVDPMAAAYQQRPSPVLAAALSGRDDIIQLLREWTQDEVLSQNSLRPDPLHEAARYGCETMVKLLLEAGEGKKVDVNKRDLNGSTALHIALETDAGEGVISLLAKAPAYDYSSCDGDGYTPLHRAIHRSARPDRTGEKAVLAKLQILLDAGCSPCVRDQYGKMALQTPGISLGIARVLVKAGAPLHERADGWETIECTTWGLTDWDAYELLDENDAFNSDCERCNELTKMRDGYGRTLQFRRMLQSCVARSQSPEREEEEEEGEEEEDDDDDDDEDDEEEEEEEEEDEEI